MDKTNNVLQVKSSPTWRTLSISVGAAWAASLAAALTEFAQTQVVPTKESLIALGTGALFAAVRLVQQFIINKYQIAPIVSAAISPSNPETVLLNSGEVVSAAVDMETDEFVSEDAKAGIYDEVPTEPTDYKS